MAKKKYIVSHWKYTLVFGKHKGKTLEELYSTNKSYLRWLYDNKVLHFSEDIETTIQTIELQPLFPSNSEYPHWADEAGLDYFID